MPVQVKNRRQVLRSRIPEFQEAEIEFTGPDGTAHKLPLIELSTSGGSFLLPERIPGLEVGTMVEGSVIRIGEFEIHVNLQIRHVTRVDPKRYECGVQLYTMNEQDGNELTALISQLQRDADAIRGAESG